MADGEEFTDEKLNEPYCSAFESLNIQAGINSLPAAERTVVITVPAGDTVIDPGESVPDFGQPYRVEEKPAGSTERYTPVNQISELVIRAPFDRIACYELEQGVLKTCGATQDVELRISYYSNGLPDPNPDAHTGYPNSLQYLGLKTAALALEPREEGAALSARLESRAVDALQSWLQWMVKQQQSIRITRPPFGRKRR